jgi:pimeloyl-ACP methyl ester carboxylesterase
MVSYTGAYLSVYNFYVDNEDATADRDPVLLIAGCANSVAIYCMLDERSLPNFLFANGYDVWAMDVRGYGVL